MYFSCLNEEMNFLTAEHLLCDKTFVELKPIQIAYNSDIFLLMHYCPYKYYIGFVTLSSTDKQNNLEMSSLLILPIFTLLVYTRLTPVSLP